MEGEVRILFFSIVLQRQHTDTVSTGFDGSVVIDHSTNASRTTQHALAEDVGNSFRSIGLGTQSTTQLLILSLSTVIHDKYPTLQNTQGTTQVVVVTRNRISTSTLLDDTQRRIFVVLRRDDGSR